MHPILELVAPVFGLMLVGYAAAGLGWFDGDATRGLVRFVFNFAIPALLFRSLALLELPERVDWGYLLSFFGGSVAVWALGMMAARMMFGRPAADAAIFGMSAGFSNTVLLGIPLLTSAYGPEATLPVFMLIALHSPLLMPLTVVLVQVGRGETDGLVARLRSASSDLVRTPIVTGLLAGLAVNFLGITLPVPADRALALLSAAAVPCALFAMGASLAAIPIRGDLPPALLLATLKLLLHPLIVWALAVPVLGLEGLGVRVAVTMAAMPSGINAYLFAARYGAAEGVASRAVFASTAASIVTIPWALYLLG